MARRRDKGRERALAEERIAQLVALAGEAGRAGRWDRAHRYAEIAHLLSLKHELGTPAALRGRVCRACRAFLVPGATARVRLREGKRVTTCLRCGAVRRRPYHGEPASPGS